jgi:hypothetical protein
MMVCSRNDATTHVMCFARVQAGQMLGGIGLLGSMKSKRL